MKRENKHRFAAVWIAGWKFHAGSMHSVEGCSYHGSFGEAKRYAQIASARARRSGQYLVIEQMYDDERWLDVQVTNFERVVSGAQ